MKALVLTISLFLAASAFAQEAWLKGDSQATYMLDNTVLGSEEFSILPVFGLEGIPLIQPSKAYLQTPEFVESISSIVPRDHELVTLLQLTEDDFEQATLSSIKHDMQNGFFGQSHKPTASQKKAWKVVNSNKNERMKIGLKMTSSYQPFDFEVISHQGEGGEWRASCFAGFRFTIELEVASVNFPDNASLTKSAKGIVGTRMKVQRPSGVGRTFLDMQIDLNPETGKAFSEECKKQKALL